MGHLCGGGHHSKKVARARALASSFAPRATSIGAAIIRPSTLRASENHAGTFRAPGYHRAPLVGSGPHAAIACQSLRACLRNPRVCPPWGGLRAYGWAGKPKALTRPPAQPAPKSNGNPNPNPQTGRKAPTAHKQGTSPTPTANPSPPTPTSFKWPGAFGLRARAH